MVMTGMTFELTRGAGFCAGVKVAVVVIRVLVSRLWSLSVG